MHGPRTLLGRAAQYTWRNQLELGQFLRDPRIPLDNNRAENAMRLVALGRKNFLFVHSEEAGHSTPGFGFVAPPWPTGCLLAVLEPLSPEEPRTVTPLAAAEM